MLEQTSPTRLQIAELAVALLVLISVPIWTHPVPPLSDYVNHLARMHVIASPGDARLASFYEIDWAIIPNLTMDLLVPPLARWVNIFLAGQIFLMAMFVVMIGGTLALSRALLGRWSVVPLIGVALLYNNVFLVGLTNYLFGVGVSLWALAGWIALREKFWPWRYGLSIVCVVALFFCHLSALGLYGVGLLSFESARLYERRAEPWPRRIAEFVAAGLPFLAAIALLAKSPTLALSSEIYWDQRGKLDGLVYVVTDYSDIVAFGILALVIGGSVWAARRGLLRFHPVLWWLLGIGGLVYLALPRVMFETYMADQRVPIGLAFMLLATGSVDFARSTVRRAVMMGLFLIVAARVIEIDVVWSQLSESVSQFHTSVRRIQPGSKVFVAYADRSSAGDDVRDLGLVHAACLAIIERSALVTTAFTVVGKQIMHVRPQYLDRVDTRDGTPPTMSQLLVAADRPQDWMPTFWKNWRDFDYLYVLFTEDEAANPDPAHLRLVADGDRFQLYRIEK